MKRWMMAFALILFSARLGMAGWYLQWEIQVPPTESKKEKADSVKESEPVPEKVPVDFWLEKTAFKIKIGPEETPWMLWIGEKEWYAFGYLEKPQGEEKGKEKKVTLTGTVDEFLQVLESFFTQFQEIAKMFPATPEMKDSATSKVKESKEKVKVDVIEGEQTIAGCKTQGIIITVQEKDKIQETAIWFCPEITYTDLQKSFVSVSEKLQKFAEKWLKSLSLPVPQVEEIPGGYDLMEKWTGILEKIKGVPFGIIAREITQKEAKIFQAMVSKYQKMDIPPATFSVPKDYEERKLTTLVQQVLGSLGELMGAMPGMLPGEKD